MLVSAARAGGALGPPLNHLHEAVAHQALRLYFSAKCNLCSQLLNVTSFHNSAPGFCYAPGEQVLGFVAVHPHSASSRLRQ